MLDREGLVALARDANGVAIQDVAAALHAPVVAQFSRQVAEGAAVRVSIDLPPESYATFLVRHAKAG